MNVIATAAMKSAAWRLAVNLGAAAAVIALGAYVAHHWGERPDKSWLIGLGFGVALLALSRVLFVSILLLMNIASGRPILYEEDGHVIYLHRLYFCVRASEIVEISCGRIGTRSFIHVDLAGGKRKSILANLLSSPPQEVVDRLKRTLPKAAAT